MDLTKSPLPMTEEGEKVRRGDITQDSGPPKLRRVTLNRNKENETVGSVLQTMQRRGKVALCLSESDMEVALPMLEKHRRWRQGGIILLFGSVIKNRSARAEVVCARSVENGGFRTFPLVLSCPLTENHFTAVGEWEYDS